MANLLMGIILGFIIGAATGVWAWDTYGSQVKKKMVKDTAKGELDTIKENINNKIGSVKSKINPKK